MRTVLLALLCLGSVAAHASYELMLYGDNSSSTPVIQRYDPISGVYLGSIGKNFIPNTIYSVAVNHSAGEVYVLSSGRVTKLDYSTGEFRGAFTVNPAWTDIAYNPSVGRITLAEGNGSGLSTFSNQYSTSGVALDPTPGGAFFSTAPIYLTPNRYVSFGLTVNAPYYISSLLNDVSSGTPMVVSPTAIAWATSNGIRQAAYTNGSLYGMMYDFVASQVKVYRSSVTPSSVSVPALALNLGTPVTANLNIALGHNGNVYMRNGSTVTIFHDPTSTTIGALTLPVGNAANIRGMAIVVAPEPTTWLGLAAGMAFLIRRRKR